MSGVLSNFGLASTNEGTNLFLNYYRNRENVLTNNVECLSSVTILETSGINSFKQNITFAFTFNITFTFACLSRTALIIIARMVIARCCALRISRS